jgi:ABC-type transport system substrate-binding protein
LVKVPGVQAILSPRFGRRSWRAAVVVLAGWLATACGEAPWNDPYPADQAASNRLYSSFDERPKHLDPARAYSANEYAFLAQIYEPPLQYHYLLRPYRLIPLTAREVPQPRYFDATGRELPADANPETIHLSEYLIQIQSGIRYQPHPSLARDAQGRYLYHDLRPADLRGVKALEDFAQSGTRDLTAHDYLYQIKRLAAPWTHSPIAGLMEKHIVGFGALAEALAASPHTDGLARAGALRGAALDGVQVIDDTTLRIRVHGKYPQFIYWLAMPFFAPMPWEADVFYAQSGMRERNLVLDWYPIGTGPYMLSENNPNLRMVLERNPSFRGEPYPSDGMPGETHTGILADAGQTMPFVDQAIYSLEKESIPRWNKFLQGYYDSSGISSDAFDQAVQIDVGGEPVLTEAMRERAIGLSTSVEPSVFYMGFNMLDPVIGGDSERARRLRRAIAIAVDFEEFISIFSNGRGLAAQGPIPPGIFGHIEGEAGINPFVYRWADGRAVRRDLVEAKNLMAEAGYPDGRDALTGRALTIHYEAIATGPDDRARLNWIRKQFAKLGVELVIRSTDYNRFQEKMRNGTGQVYMWGWNADYPDPENFLFLLYGPNGKMEHGGENAANYANPEFDRLFDTMRFMDDGPERQAVIDRMVDIVRADGPWLWGFNPKAFSLHHQWVHNAEPNQMANNTLKYLRVDAERRQALRAAWNRPLVWPLWAAGLILVLVVAPALWMVRRRERSTAL